jgi:hypothetical protein
MGAYIDPPNESKEDFLIREGEHKHSAPPYKDIPKDKKLVILINNGPFTAAAIAFNAEEYDNFIKRQDSRPKRFYLVETEKLFPVSNLKDWLSF